tara:strand:- start:12466 stop:13392 length:927 start_codon:yes stop_codon:yes gene_type:complete
MKPLFLLYLFSLFVIFTPGVFFSLAKKDSFKGLVLHGLLFALCVFFSLKLFDRKIVEGHSFTVNLSDINNLFKPKPTMSAPSASIDMSNPELSDSEKNILAVQNLRKEMSEQNKTIRDTTNSAIDEIKQEINDYKFNTKKFDFTCSQFIKNSDFKLPEQENNSYKYLNGTDVVPNWRVRNIAIMNNSDDWGFETPYPKGNQALAIQNNGSISTDLYLPPGTYKVILLANGRDCCDNTGIANSLLFSLNNKVFDKITPDILEWKEYTTTIFKVANEGRYLLTISGSNKNAVNGIIDKTSAIKNIKIIRE